MPTIEPLSADALPQSLMADIDRYTANRLLSSTIPVRIWAHRPALAAKWLATMDEIHSNGTLSARVRELVRLKIASITTCRACNLARKSDEVTEDDIACMSSEDPRFAPDEQAATRYAELFAGDYFSSDEDVWDGLEAHFSTEQIVELCMFSALMLAGGRMTYVQRAYEDSSSTNLDKQDERKK